MPSTTSHTSSQTPSVNGWHLNNTTKQHLPWPIDRQAMSPPCCPPATSHLPPLATCCLPLAAQRWCWPVPIATWLLVSHPLQSVLRSLSKPNKNGRHYLLKLFEWQWQLWWWRWWQWQQWWPTAMATVMADSNGDWDGRRGGQRQWQWQWPTAIAMAMATAMEMTRAMANSNDISNSQRQWQWLTATAMVMVDDNGNGNGNGDGGGDRNGDGDSSGNDDRHDDWHKGGLPLHVPAMCSTVSGEMPYLPPLDTKECALPSAAPWGCHCKECLLHFNFKGGWSWEFTMDWFFCFFSTTCSVY